MKTRAWLRSNCKIHDPNRLAHKWLRSNCAFAQREQSFFEFYEPSQYRPIPEPGTWDDPTADPMGTLREVLEDNPKYLIDFLRAYPNVYEYRQVAFEDAGSDQKASPVIVVEFKNKTYVIDSIEDGYPDITEANEWVSNVDDHQLGYYVGYKDFNQEFWDESSGLVLYHATDPKNVKSILANGLNPTSETRAISNRYMAAAVFTGPSPESLSSYGTAVFAIDVGAMKADGYMPTVSQEEPFEEGNMRDALAYKIGLEDYHSAEEYSSEGLAEDTVAFFGHIPPKYLSLT